MLNSLEQVLADRGFVHAVGTRTAFSVQSRSPSRGARTAERRQRCDERPVVSARGAPPRLEPLLFDDREALRSIAQTSVDDNRVWYLRRIQ